MHLSIPAESLIFLIPFMCFRKPAFDCILQYVTIQQPHGNQHVDDTCHLAARMRVRHRGNIMNDFEGFLWKFLPVSCIKVWSQWCDAHERAVPVIRLAASSAFYGSKSALEVGDGEAAGAARPSA